MKKVFFILVALTVGVGAQAGDRKIGNVVAVEREISDIYNTCLKKADSDTSKPQSFFSCSIKYIVDGEIAVSSGRMIKLIDDKCSVIGEAINGTLIITYASAQKPSSFESSRTCLERALIAKDPLKLLVYTIE